MRQIQLPTINKYIFVCCIIADDKSIYLIYSEKVIIYF